MLSGSAWPAIRLLCDVGMACFTVSSVLLIGFPKEAKQYISLQNDSAKVLMPHRRRIPEMAQDCFVSDSVDCRHREVRSWLNQV